MTIQPAAVYPPGRSPAQAGGGGGQHAYDTFNTREVPPEGPGFDYSGSRMTRWFGRLPAQPNQVRLSRQLPAILQNRSVVFHSWIIAMVIIGFDEWHNLHILPRPSRLWSASLFYGLLILFSVADPLVPLANAFAAGYTFTLLWQYYNGNLTPAAQAQPQGGG